MEDEIKLLFSKSSESITDSIIAIDNERYSMFVNRSYYAVFYAAKALLLKKGVITKTHAGTIQQFGFEYVVNDNFNEKIVKIFSDLEEFRENSDYDVYFIVKEENAIENLNKAEEFIEECRRFS
jgi:uncharacterized protein (UPF0332 family)